MSAASKKSQISVSAEQIHSWNISCQRVLFTVADLANRCNFADWDFPFCATAWASAIRILHLDLIYCTGLWRPIIHTSSKPLSFGDPWPFEHELCHGKVQNSRQVKTSWWRTRHQRNRVREGVSGVSARHDINCQLFPVSVEHPAWAAESDCCPWWRKLYRTKGFALNDTLALRFVALARSPSLSPSWSSMLHWLSNLHRGVMNWRVKAMYQLCLQWKSMDTWDTWAFGKMPFGSIGSMWHIWNNLREMLAWGESAVAQTQALNETTLSQWRPRALDAYEKCIRCFMMRLVKRLASPPWCFSSSQDSQHLAASRSISQHFAAAGSVLCCKASAHKMRYQKADEADEYAALLGWPRSMQVGMQLDDWNYDFTQVESNWVVTE